MQAVLCYQVQIAELKRTCASPYEVPVPMSGDRFIMDAEDSAPSHPLQATCPYAPSPSTKLPSRTTPTPARTQQVKMTISQCTSLSTRTTHGRQLHRHKDRLHRLRDKAARAPTTSARYPSSSRVTRPRHIKPHGPMHTSGITRSTSPSSYIIVIKPRCHATTFKSTPTTTSTLFPNIGLAPTRRSHSTNMSFLR